MKIQRFTLYMPNGKFGVKSLNIRAKYDEKGNPIYPKGWMVLTQEQLAGLANKTLAWAEDGTLKPYTKTEAEILAEKAQKEKEQAREEIAELQQWFNNIYDAQIKQAQRCERLGLVYDNKYGTVAELDLIALEKQARIATLKEILRK